METFQFGNDEVEITPALSVTHRLCYPHPNLISWLMVNNLLVASLRSQFSLVYLCVQFVFSAAALHFLVRWISRLIALWSKGVYIPSLHFFCENNPEPWPAFSRLLANEDLFFLTIMGSYTSEIITAVMINEGAKVLDTVTTLMGLPDLASDGSPLFGEPMFLFGCALCNTSTYCMLTLWLSCVNHALRGEFPLLHRLLQDIFTYIRIVLATQSLSFP